MVVQSRFVALDSSSVLLGTAILLRSECFRFFVCKKKLGGGSKLVYAIFRR